MNLPATISAAEASDPSTAAALDEADPLRAFQERFVRADDDAIYLDGNSLGRLPTETPIRLEQLVREGWGRRLIRSWEDGWLELPLTIGDLIGSGLLGAAPGQVAVADSTTVCLYKLASAALAARPGRREIVTDTDNFPTDRYVLESLAAQHGLKIRWITAPRESGPDAELVSRALSSQTALVSLSHIAYRSAHVSDMAAISRVVHEAGALVLWDLCHSVGVHPIALDADQADLAVGCTYKYLNSGPGAPAFMYVRNEHQATLRQPIWGWLGRRDPFQMGQGYEPGTGIVAMLSGTPPVLALDAVRVGAEIVIEAGIERVRAKAVALGEYAIALSDLWLARLGVRLGSPRESARRGGHVALVHPEAEALCRRSIAADVIVDFRGPDMVRVGLSPLTTSFREVHEGLAALRDLLRD